MVSSFKSVLDKVGEEAKTIFDKIVSFAKAEEPVVDTLFPGIAPLYNATVAAVGSVEMLAASAGKQSGSAEQKLATAVSTIAPLALAYFKTQGIVADTSVIENYVNTVVAGLKAIPAPTVAVPAVAK